MATQIIMPKLGMAMVEGAVVKWVKRDGETVNKGDPLVVVMSKKISYQIKAPATGIVRHVAQEKETRPVGAVIGYILAPGEALPEIVPPPAAGAPSPEAAPFIPASPAARRLAKELGIDLAQVTATGPEGRITEADVQRAAEERARAAAPLAGAPAEVLTSPMARTLAREHGVDLAQVKGTGAGGRVTEKDVLAYLEQRRRAPAAPEAPPAARAIPFIGMRLAIAERMTESLRTTAQVTITTEADVTGLVEFLERLKQRVEVSYTSIIVRAVAAALRRHPMVNSTLIGDEIRILEEIHIGVGVALEDGLIVPVIRNADRLTITEIDRELKRLADAARSGSLTVDEVTGSTFTISNLGMYGVDAFTPIINPPEVAILGVGRIAEKPAVHRGEITVRSLMTLSLTFDHRIVDGAPAAAFLQTLREMLEQPVLIFAGEGI